MWTSASLPPTDRCIGIGVSHSPRDCSDDGIAHRVDDLPEDDGTTNFLEADGAHQRRIRRWVSRLTLRPESTTTAGVPTLARLSRQAGGDRRGRRRFDQVLVLVRASSARRRRSPPRTRARRRRCASAGPRRAGRPIPPSIPAAAVSIGGSVRTASPLSSESFKRRRALVLAADDPGLGNLLPDVEGEPAGAPRPRPAGRTCARPARPRAPRPRACRRCPP